MDKVLNMTYASSLTNLCEVNSSFDTGILRICYTGDNRNGSHISKKAIKKSLQTIYNCPIVCNYDRGWDIKPVDADTQMAYEILVHTENY